MQDKVVSFLIKHCAKVGELLTDIGVLDLYDTGSMKLLQMRKEIQKSWSDIQFEFLEKQKFPIGRGNEQMKLLKTIVRRSQKEQQSGYSIIDILVKNEEGTSLGTQKKMKETQDRELLLNESNKNKERINQSLKSLQEFCKKASLISQQNNEEYRKEVNDLQNSLLKNGIQITFSKNLQNELQVARGILYSKIKQQEELIEHLSKIQAVNIKQMLAKNEATLMRSFYKSKIVHYHVPNIEACTFEYAQIGNDATQSQCTFVSQDQHQILQSKIEKEKKRYAASLGVENIWARIEASLEAKSCKGSSSSKEAQEKYESSTSQKTMVYIGESLSFSLDSIKLKSEVVNEFVQLYNSFTQIKKANQKEGEAQRKKNVFKKKVIEYFQLYGDQMELGGYSFGSTYEADSTLNFQGKVSKSQIKTEAAKCLNFNVRGGYALSPFVQIDGSFEVNNNSSNKQQKSEGSQSISYSCSSNFKAFPKIKNCEKWSSIVAKNRSFWKVVKADIQLVKLIKIIKSHQNRPSFYNDDDSDVHNFEQQIEEILSQENSRLKSAFRDQNTGKWLANGKQCKNQNFLSSGDGKAIRIKREILFYTQCLPKSVKLHKKVLKIESGLACMGLLFYNNSLDLETKTSTQIKFTDVSKIKTSLQIEGGQFLFLNVSTNDEVSFQVNMENEQVNFLVKGENKQKNYKPKLIFGGKFVCIGAYELEGAAVIKEIC